MASLTKSQQLVYDYLCSTMAERAVPPSVREICAATGLRSTSTVHSHLKSLEALGYITRDAGLNRSIHIVGASAAKQVPILGKVTAGLPILAVEDIEGYIPYPDMETCCSNDRRDNNAHGICCIISCISFHISKIIENICISSIKSKSKKYLSDQCKYIWPVLHNCF